MQGPPDPAIQASLLEAADYERVQWQRRRGVYAGLLSLGWISLGLWRAFHLSTVQWIIPGILVMLGALIFIARRRPAWVGVFARPGTSGPPLLRTWPGRMLVFLLFFGYAMLGELPQGRWLVAGRIVAFSILMAFIVRTRADRTMQWVLVASAGVAGLVLLGLLPATVGVGAWLIVMGTAWFVVALARVFGPRSWVIP